MISVIDYEMGNLGSIVNMFKRLGVRAKLVQSAEEVLAAEKLVLPGVGHWDHGMAQLDKLGLRSALDEMVLHRGTPVLGICLGMQLMTRSSEEGELPGLGWIEGDTVHFKKDQPADAMTGLKLPHIGWNFVDIDRPHPVIDKLPEEPRFYFVHTYRVVCDRPGDELLHASYGPIDFVAGFARDNVVGMQCHPEKSHKFGMQVFRDFAAWSPAVREAAE